MKYFEPIVTVDEDTFKLIMEQWYSKLFNFANGYLNNIETSKEVIQDVFLQLWDNRKKLAKNTSLNAYLFTLTRNRCIDLIRRERLILQFRTDRKDEYIRLTENNYALNDPILDNIFAFELELEINRVIEKLPDQCKKVFLLSRKTGLKNKEISLTLEISEKTVESHITKALKSIRSTLLKKFPGSINLITFLLKKENSFII